MVFLSHASLFAAATGHGEQRTSIFFLQLALLIVSGRLLGEWMQRYRQPAVVGQLLAGIILGLSVFGVIWPTLQQTIFPANASDRQMLNAVSELGVLMLLLLTGMETDLAIVKRVRRTAVITSAAGIIIPSASQSVDGLMCGMFWPVTSIVSATLSVASSRNRWMSTAMSLRRESESGRK